MDTVSFQLYSARNFQPYADVIAMLARTGYKQVEGFGGMYDDPAALKAMLDKNGLSMPTGHFNLSSLETDMAGSLATIRTLGVKTVIVPYLVSEDRPTDSAGWTAFGKRLQSLAEALGKHGFKLAWHNHDFEFVATADGGIPQALLLDAAPDVLWEIDVAWVIKAGVDPVVWIKRYAKRIASVHLKDIAPAGIATDEDGWADVGHGTVDWAPIMTALRASTASVYVVEHDNPNDVNRFASRSFATASKL
jgi:sugar phosphate isomerase/epimerase